MRRIVTGGGVRGLVLGVVAVMVLGPCGSDKKGTSATDNGPSQVSVLAGLNDQQDPENVTQRINNRVVLYSHDSVDITNAVVERLNSEYKKQKAAGDKKDGEKKPDGK